ncbi:hypothetical protein [Sphingopyxis macrogoltabida]|uniref:Uncharacterized protein n=1 Tax=Sphingopyxis macrogoltabida TaxID=33050 RepID=A0AAC8Z2U0_SPHMC|nr:hypothetical protein [Sphingopyxis macrogoltabida]ALJ14267.1 hypothetical protein LH19_15460 [Sphingopyxis macrogoltabida]AMU90532.1 hypothetical protein ATM17_16030 [Sphingopyxis macrogoltabida]
MEPYEIISGPLELWRAPVGTAFPLIDAAPGVGWILVGKSGKKNYSDDGVSVQHNQTNNKVRPAGSIGARKALRQDEDQRITVTLWDATLEQYSLALSGNDPTTVAAGVGTAGYKSIGLSRGETVKEFAVLARGKSAYDENMNAQYEVPRCYQDASPTVLHNKGVPAGLELAFEALEDDEAESDDERFGRLIMQTAAPLPGGG